MGIDLTGAQLLASAAVVLVVNVITFALVFWEIDCGGPVARALAERRPTPDFQFPQDENPQLARAGWAPALNDYLYVAVTNSIAFSPTDAMPLTHRAKLFMGIESLIAAVTVLIVAARAVNILARLSARRAEPSATHTNPYARHRVLPVRGASMGVTSKSPERRRNDETHEGTHALATVTALALMVGVGTAIAATTGSSDLKQEAARITARASFDAAVAKSLGTTTAKLDAAITAAATARIDAALAADEITAAEAATLKDALADGMPAMRLATAAGVAKELGTTEAKLNAAYSDAQKAQAKARVDEALAAGQHHGEVRDRAEGATSTPPPSPASAPVGWAITAALAADGRSRAGLRPASGWPASGSRIVVVLLLDDHVHARLRSSSPSARRARSGWGGALRRPSPVPSPQATVTAAPANAA